MLDDKKKREIEVQREVLRLDVSYWYSYAYSYENHEIDKRDMSEEQYQKELEECRTELEKARKMLENFENENSHWLLVF